MFNPVPVGKRTRYSYARIKEVMEMPHLLDIQRNSYKWFMKEGMREIFRDISPIQDFTENLVLSFEDFFLGKPKYELDECKERDVTYAAPLRVVVRLANKETGEIKEQEVFMGDFPLMTDTGTFIINGAERVIVSQLVRSPGAYYNETIDSSGKKLYAATVIPNRGAWIELETDVNDVLSVRIDRTRKLPVTVLVRALGYSTDEEILELFDHHPLICTTLEREGDRDKDKVPTREDALREIYHRLRPGELATTDNAQQLLKALFFDPKRYDLAMVGRYKLTKKLGWKRRLLGHVLAEPLVDRETGEVVVPADVVVEESMLEGIDAEKEHAIFGDGGDISLFIRTGSEERPRMKMICSPTLEHHYRTITKGDIMASINYLLNLVDGVGTTDDIDHLGNRRVRSVGELLQNQFRIGLSRMERVVKERMSIADASNLTPKQLTNIRPLTAAIKEFFSSSQLSQFMDQQNPLAELSNKRRISALGPGGLTRERAGFEVRDIHNSHYGRICPIETPEGPNIGLISYLTTYARVNEYGFIQTPYRKVVDGYVTDEIQYMSADEENDHVIAQANEIVEGRLVGDRIVARIAGETVMVSREEIDFADVSPRQIVSVATACVPFLENDDCTRALMGANMQRQAVPLLNPHSPFVGTGMEHRIARDSGAACVATAPGVVTYVDATKVVVQEDSGKEKTYELTKYRRSNSSTCLNQRPIVFDGERVERGDILADGPAMQNGELALGQNVLIAFMTWHGYNYEDAIIMSERMVREDVYTSVHIEEYDIECRDTKLGPEEITRDIPNVAESACRNLDARGIVMVGAEVKEGDILVGKVTPKGQSEISPEEKLLLAIFGEKSREVRDNSLKVPHGGAGIVHSVRIFKRKDDHELSPGVNEVVKVYVVQKRKISEGDKMAGRHGNKGVISRIMPIEDMPYMQDGTPIDIMLNPFGVPSRMNIGQVLEVHLGMAARSLNCKFATPVFDGVSNEDLRNIMKEANTSADGKYLLTDGMTGEPYDERIAVGVMYMIKLAHMVDDKLHARATGPYSLVTQQPLGGKAQNGGQRFGEMEVWALEAYGAAHTLQEILTVKSDDIMGRTKTYEAIVKGKDLPEPGIPESFRVLVHELQALAVDVKMVGEDGEEMDLKQMEQEELKEETTLDLSRQNIVNDAEAQSDLTITDSLEEEIPEAAAVGFDDFDDTDQY